MMIISGGKFLDLANNTCEQRDLLLNNGIIEAIDNPDSFNSKDVRVVDATDCLVVPGLVDLGVHLREPGYEWKENIESGIETAIAGGFVGIACFADTIPVNDNAEITKYVVDRSKRFNKCEVYPLGSLSKGLSGQQLSPYLELHSAGCFGFSDIPKAIQSAAFMRRAFEWCEMHDLPVITSPEDYTLSAHGVMHEGLISERIGLKGVPVSAETTSLLRDIEIAAQTGGKLHVFNISSKRSVDIVRRAKGEGINVSVGVSISHLLYTENQLETFDTNLKVKPPLRTEQDRIALIEGINEGVIDVICSHHEPHEIDLKRMEFGMATDGIIGMQTLLPSILKVVREDNLDLYKGFAALTIKPSGVLGVDVTGKSKLKANLTILDPKKKWVFNQFTNRSKSKNTPLYETELTGRVFQTIFNGETVYEDKNDVG